MFKGEKNRVKTENPDRLNRLVSGTKLTGDLTTSSSLRVDGTVEGNIFCDGKLVLGQEGKIVGNINAVEVEIDGTVDGHINAEDLLTLHQTAVITGNIRTVRLVIADGAHIEGNILTGDLPKGSNSVLKTKKESKSGGEGEQPLKKEGVLTY